MEPTMTAIPDFSNDTATFKKSLLGGLVTVLTLIWAPFPDLSARVIVVETEENIKPVRYRPPNQPEQVVRPEVQRINQRIPMPTIDEIQIDEPSVEPLDLASPAVLPSNDWEFAVMEPPPAVGPVVLGTPGLEPPLITQRFQPNYPVSGMQVGMSGYVLLEAVLGKNGEIRDIRVLRQLGRGKFGFEEEAIQALKQWKFVPGRLNGRNTDVRMTLRIEFQIS